MKTIYLIIIGVSILVAGFFIGRSTLSNKKIDNLITTTQLQTALLNQKDYLDTQYSWKLIDSSKVIQSLHKKISDGLKPIITHDHQSANAATQASDKDTASAYLCRNALTKQEQLVYHMGIKAYNDSIQLYECNKQGKYIGDLVAKKDSTIKAWNDTYNKMVSTIKKATGEKTFTPFVNASYNSFGYYGAGAGIYIKNIGLGAKYITNFSQQGYEVSLGIKF